MAAQIVAQMAAGFAVIATRRPLLRATVTSVVSYAGIGMLLVCCPVLARSGSAIAGMAAGAAVCRAAGRAFGHRVPAGRGGNRAMRRGGLPADLSAAAGTRAHAAGEGRRGSGRTDGSSFGTMT